MLQLKGAEGTDYPLKREKIISVCALLGMLDSKTGYIRFTSSPRVALMM